VRWRTAGRIAIGWVLTLPAAAAVGAFAALIVVLGGGWGVLIDAVLALVVIIGLFLRSRRNAVTANNAFSEVADSGRAVEVPEEPPLTPRQARAQRARERAKSKEAGR
jgi:PiT family inorganic phosphate transporter